MVLPRQFLVENGAETADRARESNPGVAKAQLWERELPLGATHRKLMRIIFFQVKITEITDTESTRVSDLRGALRKKFW